MVIEVFTDGAYSSMREQGGIGVVFVIDGKKVYEYSNTIPNATNNKCELLAVIFALRAISKPIDSLIIYSDSQYVIGCATKGWQRKKNIALWRAYDNVYKRASELCSDIRFVWVKGHENKNDFFSQMNNLADNLAVEASHVILEKTN